MEQPLTHIQPPGRFSTGFREIWHYRELFYFFTWRDIKVKYKIQYVLELIKQVEGVPEKFLSPMTRYDGLYEIRIE